MNPLTIRFMWTYTNQDLPNHYASGPLFTRWLPDGENDKLILPTDDPDTQLEVWLERMGYVDGLIKFDHKRREVDSDLMSRQGRLDGGFIFGALTVKNVSDATIDVLKNNQTNHPLYEAVGNQIVKTLSPSFSRFLDVLTKVYGQYWLAPMIEWDSRVYTLGAYCKLLYMKWRIECDGTWAEFLPTDQMTTITSTDKVGGFNHYLTKTDWSEIQSLCSKRYEPTNALRLLANSHFLLDQDQLKFAILEGYSALDVAVNELVRHRRVGFSPIIGNAVSPFLRQEKLPVQVSLLAILNGDVSSDDLEAC